MSALKLTILILNLTQPFVYCGQISYNSKSNTIFFNSDENLVKMMVLGDWGGFPFSPYYSPFQFVTAKQMMQMSAQDRADFVLALGDNFYFTGVKDVHDRRFKNTFENVFNEPHFQTVPWFLLGGNHDHYGNISAQIDYSKVSSRWNFPNLWYTVRVKTPTHNMTIVMIDTVVLCGNVPYTEHVMTSDGDVIKEDVEYEQPNEKEVDPQLASAQLQFIENNLKDNKDAYVFVAGHFPVWSIAEHGPTQCLIDKLRPMLEKYDVTAYFSGHDHNLQHIAEPGSRVEYFVSGAGDMVFPSTRHLNDIPVGSLKYHWANPFGMGGFASLHMSAHNATWWFHDGLGRRLYERDVKPRR